LLSRNKLLVYLVVFWLETAFTVWTLTVTVIEGKYTFVSGLLLGFFLAVIWILTVRWWIEHVFKELSRMTREAELSH
jgi:hypothetical protein